MKKRKNHIFLSLIITSVCIITVAITFFIRKENNIDLPHITYISENNNNVPEQQWYLILVNEKNSIPKNYSFELTELSNGRSIRWQRSGGRNIFSVYMS